MAFTRQRPINSNRVMVFSSWSTLIAVHATFGYSNRGTVFSFWSVMRWYKQDSWGVRHSISEWEVEVGIEELGSGVRKRVRSVTVIGGSLS
jgi:hypothetical protein